MKTEYNEQNVIRALQRTGFVSINSVQKTIKIVKDSFLGGGSWGKIDYLCKIHGYVYQLYTKHDINADEKVHRRTKMEKREMKDENFRERKQRLRNRKKND